MVPGVFPGPGPTLPGSRLVSCQPLGPLGTEKTGKSQFTRGVSMKFPGPFPHSFTGMDPGEGAWEQEKGTSPAWGGPHPATWATLCLPHRHGTLPLDTHSDGARPGIIFSPFTFQGQFTAPRESFSPLQAPRSGHSPAQTPVSSPDSVQIFPLESCCSVALLTPWTAARQASLPFTISWSLLKLMSIESVMPSNHPLLSSPPPALNLSRHQGLFQ